MHLKLRLFVLPLLMTVTTAMAASVPVVVPFDFSRSALGVEVSVKGTPLYMLVDTGVDPSVIDIAKAETLSLPMERDDAGEASGFGDGKGAAVVPAQIEGLAVEGHPFGAVEALAVDMRQISAAYGRPVDGILGYSFLSDKIVLIDYPAQRLAVLDRTADAAQLTETCKTHWTAPLTTVDSFPVIPDFHFGTVQAPVSFDTGSNGAIGLFQSALDLPGMKEALVEQGDITRTGARGDGKSKSFSLNLEVGFGPFHLPAGQATSLYPDQGSPETRVANIGNRLMAGMKLKVLLDYPGKTIAVYGNCGTG